MRLENWYIVWANDEDYLAPELRHKRVQGQVYGHENFKDGTFIITSALMEINLGEMYVKTMNSCYDLGTPDPEYIKAINEFKGEKE